MKTFKTPAWAKKRLDIATGKQDTLDCEEQGAYIEPRPKYKLKSKQQKITSLRWNY